MEDSMSLEAIKVVLNSIKPPINREEDDGCVVIDDWDGGNIDDACQLGLDDARPLARVGLFDHLAEDERQIADLAGRRMAIRQAMSSSTELT
jgi:hypothetical protein